MNGFPFDVISTNNLYKRYLCFLLKITRDVSFVRSYFEFQICPISAPYVVPFAFPTYAICFILLKKRFFLGRISFSNIIFSTFVSILIRLLCWNSMNEWIEFVAVVMNAAFCIVNSYFWEILAKFILWQNLIELRIYNYECTLRNNPCLIQY